ncbi:MAG: diguanylate cyclase [Clostridia bacterium]|nr:diguanylate cyclase [Clostridia bacterium]
MIKKSNVKYPLNRSIIFASALFILLLGIVISAVTIIVFRTSIYARYEKQMESILNYVEAHIDHDDMAECAKTFVKSEKYEEFQAFLDTFIDTYADNTFINNPESDLKYKDVHYIYIMKVADVGDPYEIYEVCTANSTYEKENFPEYVLTLGDHADDLDSWYEEQARKQFRAILQGSQDVFLTNDSEWGVDYTLARPVVNSKGEHYGVLCVDVSKDQLIETVSKTVIINISLVVGLGILFITLLMVWMRLNVTKPLHDLENSVVSFAETTAGKRDPNELVFTPPVIKSHNEVASLSGAVTKLSNDMRDYIKYMVAAENEAQGLQEHVNEMNEIAYKDALTQVKNKAAYDVKAESLAWDIMNNTAKFAIVMVDLNYLKVINDKYGHDKGNEYIIGSCKLICEAFVHSPVFRIGGDEFVTVLEGQDYNNREKLMKQLKEAFAAALSANTMPPWKRFSAAIGMAVFQAGDDVDAVLKRADQAMYEAKASMKAGQG